MTLTTEQLRARAKFWREKAVEAKWESVSIAQDMLQNADAFDELAANREAQPVAMGKFAGWGLYHTKSGEFGNWLKSTPESDNSHAISQGYANVKLYTAPPAPVYPERLPCPVHLLPGLKFGKGVPTRSMLDALVRRAEYEAELDAMTPEQKAENDARLDKLKELIPQPAMPGIITASMAAEKAFRLGAVLNGDEAEQFAEGWNACRAAMLAKPVSGGYKLPDSVLVLLNHIEDVLDDENWNRISVKKWNAVTMLAAAPEGGNDHDTRR
ncbi:Uncharacterised protein [Serratia marcescens]|uniref:hypothetical protein n=1 Tax=Serratia marcescens TaxID=615 RepID=UPI000744DDCC|nr:hypothetical protein [Serratia marcescens]CUZ15647.1 Uncharacterised protein [Serratia marcescens]CVD94518.1 Uncharacterised protein [Serratia marcescens]